MTMCMRIIVLLIPYVFIFMHYRRTRKAVNTAHQGNSRGSPSIVTEHRIRVPVGRIRSSIRLYPKLGTLEISSFPPPPFFSTKTSTSRSFRSNVSRARIQRVLIVGGMYILPISRKIGRMVSKGA